MRLSKLLIALFCFQANSADVYLNDPRFPAEPFTQAGFSVKSGQGTVEKSGMPSVAETNQILRKSGLERDTEKWDQVEIDLLLARAKSWSWRELSVQYSKLPADGLRALQSQLSH